MMHTLTYTSNRAGTVIDLADPEGIMCGQIPGSYAPARGSSSLGYRSLHATRPAKTVKVTGFVHRIPALERPRVTVRRGHVRLPQRCRETRRHHGGQGWSQTCLVVGHEPDYTSPLLVRGDFTVALLDGVWHKPVRQSFSRSMARYNRGRN